MFTREIGSRPFTTNLAIFLAAAIWTLLFGNPAEPLERRYFDQALQARAGLGLTPPADPRIVILGIDDADMGSLPTLEAEYLAAARFIAQASELGVSAIVLDTIYARGTEAMAAPILEKLDTGAPVVVAEAVEMEPGEIAVARRLRSFPFLPERVVPAGLINIKADTDGTHRTYPLLYRVGTTMEPSLALAAWFALRGIDWANEVTQPTPESIAWQELTPGGDGVEQHALRASHNRLLNFRGTWKQGAGFGHLSLTSLNALHSAESPKGNSPLAGKVLFVANVATGIADVGPTSFVPNEPLILLHATALNDLLQSRAIQRVPRWGDALAFLAVPILGCAFGPCSRKRALAALWAAGVLVIVAGSLLLLFRQHILAATVSAAALWTFAVVVEVSRRHSHEAAERQHLRRTMGIYFSPRVLEDVLANPGRLEPKRVEITVLITDLRNSTPLAELLGTEGMLALLNRVFEVENQAVFAEDGSLEKPVGDQFLAYWGAPDPQPDAAERALRAARRVIEGLEALRAGFEPAVRELFGYGLAVHAGPSLIANIGSAQFFHYGVVGDLINASARVEALTKTYGVRALVTLDALSRIVPRPPSRLVDRVIVKGKSVPLELHEISHSQNAATFEQVAVEYGRAFEWYEAGAFIEAQDGFAALASIDGPSRLMQKRCRELAVDPPAEWRGLFRFDSK